MDQLLNSGMGYGYQMPPLQDPDDDRTDDERLRDGCLHTVGCVIGVALALLFCALLGSCTTHRNVCGVTTEMADSLSQVIEQTAIVERKDTTATQTATVFNSSAVETSTATEEETETVNEQIVETIDSLGNRTVTTNRTTTRKRIAQEQNCSLLEQYKDEVALNVRLSYLDSLYQSSLQNTATHWADSTAVNEEKTTDTRPASLIGIIVDWLFRLTWIVPVGLLVFLVIRYLKGK